MRKSVTGVFHILHRFFHKQSRENPREIKASLG